MCDRTSELDYAREKGLAKGHAEGHKKGLKEGLIQGRREVIDLLKSGKSSEEIISEYSN
jgi:flagellar biosynthesis/type III secretory pathway protein FliH